MTDEELKRRLVIGLMTNLTLDERQSLMESGKSLDEIFGKNGYSCSSALLVLSWLNDNPGSGIWWYRESGFPKVEELEKHFPSMIFYEGRKPDIRNTHVTIVGSRRADYLGIQKSFMLGLEASVNGLSVVTGVAEGCDQAAGAGSLSAFDTKDMLYTPPVLVLPNGFDVEYPRGSAYLRNMAKERGGSILSCFVPGTPALKYNFIFRNMLMAAMSAMTLVIQSPVHSGALMTAEFALRLGRDVCVSIGGVGEGESRRGTVLLARDGAEVINSYADYASNGIDSVYNIKQVDYGNPYEVRFGDRFYNIEHRQM